MIQATAGAAVAAVAGRTHAAANSKLQHACIGVGGMMGGGDFASFLRCHGAEVVAICDVDANFLASAAAQAPHARKYADWREMLDREGDRIDSVNVTVPDHMHAAISTAALAKGKHVFSQKPMAHDVCEARAMTLAAAKNGRVTQLGNQFGSGIGERMLIDMLRHNVIGAVEHVVIMAHRPGIEAYRAVGPRPAKGSAPPRTLNWDLWLGTAPYRDYAAGYHPSTWRGWQDFGTGWSGDIGCHLFNGAYQGLELTAPKTIKAQAQESWVKSPARRAETWPQSNHITWTFPGTVHTAKELVLEWYDGEFVPPADILARIDIPNFHPHESTLFIGSEGTMFWPAGGGPELFPREKFLDIKRPTIAKLDHFQSFVDACLGGPDPQCKFAKTGPMTEVVLLGTVAIRVPGETIEWDAENMKITNNVAANKLLGRSYRAGW
jgi:predicted dehydrogenase